MRAPVLLLLVGCGGSVDVLDSGPPDAPGDTQTAFHDSGGPDSPSDAQGPDTGVYCPHPLCCVNGERYRCGIGPTSFMCLDRPEAVCDAGVCVGTRCP